MPRWTLSLNNKPIKRFSIKEGWNLTIGRGSDADVIVDNTAISRKHASLELKKNQYVISDLDSLNGTFVNGKKINGATRISVDDIIKLGKFKLALSEDDEKLEVSSYGAHPDTEDKTIIVSAQQFLEKPKNPGSIKNGNRLVLMEGHSEPEKLSLTGKSSIKIGKNASCDMILQGFFVADAQFYIVSQDSKYKLIPQRSWSKTFVNGFKVTHERILSNGDIIRVRSTKIRFYK